MNENNSDCLLLSLSCTLQFHGAGIQSGFHVQYKIVFSPHLQVLACIKGCNWCNKWIYQLLYIFFNDLIVLWSIKCWKIVKKCPLHWRVSDYRSNAVSICSISYCLPTPLKLKAKKSPKIFNHIMKKRLKSKESCQLLNITFQLVFLFPFLFIVSSLKTDSLLLWQLNDN